MADVIGGLVFIQDASKEIAEFRKDFTNINPGGFTDNIWFKEYWQQKYNCTLNNNCRNFYEDEQKNNYKQKAYVAQTIASVYAFAHAIREAREDICGTATGICNRLVNMNSSLFMEYLRNASFTNVDTYRYTFGSDWELTIPRYDVMNVQISGSTYAISKV